MLSNPVLRSGVNGDVTLRDVQTLSLADLLKKEHGYELASGQFGSPQQSLFAPQQAQQAQQALQQAPSLFSPPQGQGGAMPPSLGFLEQARTIPGGPAPAPVPLVAGPSGGLIQASPYGAAPEMPGYAMARTGNPFRASTQQGGLFKSLTQYGQPEADPYAYTPFYY
jgi:hypothetical protein